MRERYQARCERHLENLAERTWQRGERSLQESEANIKQAAAVRWGDPGADRTAYGRRRRTGTGEGCPAAGGVGTDGPAVAGGGRHRARFCKNAHCL